jgi:hypothetical protein
MAVTILLSGEEHAVSTAHLTAKCTLFKNNPALLETPYSIKARANPSDFEDFISALEDRAFEITMANYLALTFMAHEFGFEGLITQLTAFRRSALKTSDAEESGDSEDFDDSDPEPLRVNPVTWYLARYPDGWTSIQVFSEFYSDIGGLYATGSDDEGGSEDKTLSDADVQEAIDLAIIIIDTAYDRTRARLAGSNDNFLISCLCLGAGAEHHGCGQTKICL